MYSPAASFLVVARGRRFDEGAVAKMHFERLPPLTSHGIWVSAERA